MNFKGIFIDKLGEPENIESLERYIEFVKENKSEYIKGETQFHHLLPRVNFSEETKNEENIFCLTYDNHIEAHLLLAEAYPINVYLRPLNFMLEKNGERYESYIKLKSRSVKKWWIEFKKSEQYINWRNKRSENCSKNMNNGQAKKMSNVFYSRENSNSIRSKQFKDLWKNDSYREKIINSMKKERNTKEAKIRMKKAAKKKWDTMSEIDREAHREKMLIINNNNDKRKIAGEKIKEKWKDPIYREKQKNRKYSVGSKNYFYWNNGIEEKIAKEKPGEDWIRGKLTQKPIKYIPWWNNGVEEKQFRYKPDNTWKTGKLKKDKNNETN